MKHISEGKLATIIILLFLTGCASPRLASDYKFSTSSAHGGNQTALVFGMPRQQGSFLSIVNVDIETGVRRSRLYELGDQILTGNEVIEVDRKNLPQSEHDKLGKSLDYQLSYGFRLIEGGDYAIYQIGGGKYVPVCLENSALVFRVEPGKINVLDDISSLRERAERKQLGESVDNPSLSKFIDAVLAAYPNIEGDTRVVEPMGTIDFGERTSLGIFKRACASNPGFDFQ